MRQRIQYFLRSFAPAKISRSTMGFMIVVTMCLAVLVTGTFSHARSAAVGIAGQIATPVSGQAGTAVTDVRVVNNRRIPTDTIRSKLQTKVGDQISPTTISHDIQALYSLGFFDDVQFETESNGSGMIISFSVKEKPLIRAIQYKGPGSVTIAEIRQAFREAGTGLVPESPYSLDRATAAADVLKSMLVAKGYAQATVGIATERVPPNALNVIFVVDEGTR
jgi:outer membrane protein insertion porin family